MNLQMLALIFALATIGPLLSLWDRWRVPLVVVELFAGVLFGKSMLGWIDPSEPVFQFLANDIGFALVMFVAGSHVPVKSTGIRAGLGRGLLTALAIGVLAVPAGIGLAHLFGTHNGLLLSVILASSSAAIILPVLGPVVSESRSTALLTMLAQISLADVMCIVLLPLVLDPQLAAQRLLGIGLVGLAAGAVFFALRWMMQRGMTQHAHEISGERKLALELRVSLTLLFAVVALGQTQGVSPMLSGFALGLVVAATADSRRLARQLFALTDGFFGPLFFVWLGAGIHAVAVVTNPKMLLLGLSLGLTALVLHSLPWLVLRHRSTPALALNALTAAQMGVPAAAVALASQHGALQEGEGAAILLGALITIAVATVCAATVTRNLHSFVETHATLSIPVVRWRE